MKGILPVILLLAILSFLSCDKDDDQREIDEQLINEYIAERGLNAASTSSGLHYVIEEPGTSEKPDISSNISIIYTGRFLDDGIFDSSGGTPRNFPLANLIEGWREGIPLFGRGGKGILILPSHLGYGSQARPGIPPNSVLVFDIELVDFN